MHRHRSRTLARSLRLGRPALLLMACGLLVGLTDGRARAGDILGEILEGNKREAKRASGSAARKLLDREALAVTLGRQENATASKFYSQVGRKLYEAFQYERAKDVLEKAMDLDPNNQEARKYLRLTKDVLGVRMDKIRTAIEHLQGEKKVKIQEQIIELENNYYRGRQLYEEALNPPGAEYATTESVLATSIRNLDRALSRFERAREIIKWMPYHVDLSDHEQRVTRFLREARRAKKEKRLELTEHKHAKAIRKAVRRREVERRFDNKRINTLLDRARMFFDKQDYQKSELLAQEILEIDPTNFQAEEIHTQSRKNYLIKRDIDLDKLRQEEQFNLAERLQRATIPHSKYLVYPDDWEEISRRSSVQERVGEEPQWKRDILKQLDRKVTFEFVDTPLEEAVSFLQTLTKVNIILDPRAFEAGGDRNLPINLKVSNMSLQLALKWILKLADLDYTLKNQAIFISSAQNLSGEVDLKIYDVRDLTHTVTNFPGPEILVGGGSGAGGAMGPAIMLTEPGATVFEPGSLAEMIQTRVRPDSWAAELGTSIEERSGKLVVMQRPEIHKLISQLLKSFRESQTLQVVVQVRFIEVVDSFLEDIGVDWVDLPAVGYPPKPGANPLPAPTTLPAGHPTAPGASAGTGYRRTSTADFDDAPGGAASAYDFRTRSVNINKTISPFRTRLGDPTQGGYVQGSGEGAIFQMAFVGNIQAQAILHAVKRDERGNLLLAPRLTMYNNQRAYIMVANQRPYIADYDISGGVYDPEIRTILEGVVLDVKPTVSHDRRYITLELRPGTAQRLRFETIFIGGGIIDVPVQLPTIELRSVRTTATLPDGGTLLLSGLMTDHKFDAHSGIPFISDLPIIGRLFGSDLKQRERQNLLILVTANLILFDEEEEKL